MSPTLPRPPGNARIGHALPLSSRQDQDRMYPTPLLQAEPGQNIPYLLLQAGPGQDIPYSSPPGRTRTGCTLPHSSRQGSDSMHLTPVLQVGPGQDKSSRQDQDRMYLTPLLQAGPGQDIPYSSPPGRTRTGPTLPLSSRQDQDRMYHTPLLQAGPEQDVALPPLLQAGPGQDVPYPSPPGRTRTGCMLPPLLKAGPVQDIPYPSSPGRTSTGCTPPLFSRQDWDRMYPTPRTGLVR